MATKQRPDYGDLVKGIDIIDEPISTEKAFAIFRNLEEQGDDVLTNHKFKPP